MNTTTEIRNGSIWIKWFDSDKNAWNAMLKRVQSLPVSQRRFDDKTRSWMVTDSPENRMALAGFGFNGLGPPAPVSLSLPAAPVKVEPVLPPAPAPWAEVSLPEGIHQEARECQKEALQFLLWRGGRGIIGDEMGVGKRLAYGTPVLTPTKWVPVESLKAGDVVVGRDGKPTTVTGVHHHSDRPLNRVEFTDGTIIVADDEHLWSVSEVRNGKRTGPGQPRKWVVKTTGELMAKPLRDGAGNLNWMIPMSDPWQLDSSRYQGTDPYWIGVVLGDGSHSSGTRWDVCTDQWICDHCGVRITRRHDSSPYTVYSTTTNVPELVPARSWEKVVPEHLFWISAEDRLALLQGLMDTDGWGQDNGAFFSSTSENLVNAVVRLVQSLGGIALKKSPKLSKFRHKGELKEGRLSWDVSVKLPAGMAPFRLPRKLAMYTIPTKYLPSRRIQSITPIGHGPGACISVDAPDHLYVIQGGVVTHNTAEALFWIDTQKHLRPAIIVTNASTKFQWLSQAKKWAPSLRFQVCSGQRPNMDHYHDDTVYVINWDILTYWQKWFKDVVGPKAIIGDECQAISNPSSKRAKAFCSVANLCESIVPMSGTPVQTKPAQFFTVLNLIAPTVFPNHYAYLNRYCDPKHNGFSMTYDGATNIQELHRKVQSLMIRRLKKDVMELPEKSYNPIMLDCEISREYQEARDRVLALQGVPIGQLKQEIQALAQSAFKVKEQAVLQWIEDFLTSGEKLVVFAWHRSVVSFIQASLGRRCVVVNGDVSPTDRERAKHAFQTDPKVQVFLGNIQSAGEGIDGLQDVCSNMAYVELSGVPGRMMQSEDRLHRGGQRNAVSINYLLAPGTIDEAFLSILDKRRADINQVMDGVLDVNGESAVMDVWLQMKREAK